MAAEVVMPALEMAQDSGRLVRWLKAEGEFVHKGEPLMEIETDKVVVEIEASGSGVLSNVTAHPGDDVPVGQVIALLQPVGEPLPAAREAPPGSAPALPHLGRSMPVTPVARRLAAEHALAVAQIPVAAEARRITKDDVLSYLKSRQDLAGITAVSPRLRRASPKARRLASEAGLELGTLAASGPGGAVLAADVDKAVTQSSQSSPASSPPARPSGEYTALPLSGMRKVIASRLHASYQAAPHVALSLSADMTQVLHLCESLQAAAQARLGHRLTLTAVLCKVLGSALLEHPRLNAHLVEQELRQFSTVHLGVAVALADGLIVPVIRHSERAPLFSIQAALLDLAERARQGRLGLDEVSGSTFTLSNLGMFGIEHFTSILNAPEVGILSVGAVKDTAVGVDGQLALRPMMQMTLNVDHRAIDGAVGAAFLKTLRELLENPYLLL